MVDYSGAISRIKNVIIDINIEHVFSDARSYGLKVNTIEDFANQAHNHVFIEKLMIKYANIAQFYCVASGFSTGIGGVFTSTALAGVDIANMAAQLYRLNQRLSVLNGFDPNNMIHQEKSQMIYLKALGFEAAAQASIRAQVIKAAAENTAKRGPSSNVTIRLIMEVVKLLGPKITKEQAAKLVPFVGAFLGGGGNYLFSKSAANKMINDYKSDYFDRWQTESRK